MTALSIRQPWAWLIANGHKDIENRSWPTAFRGPFLIHASRRHDATYAGQFAELLDAIRLPDSFEYGGIVGVAHVVACVSESASPWFCGPYGFVIKAAKPLPLTPLPGRLGFFAVDDDTTPDPWSELLAAD